MESIPAMPARFVANRAEFVIEHLNTRGPLLVSWRGTPKLAMLSIGHFDKLFGHVEEKQPADFSSSLIPDSKDWIQLKNITAMMRLSRPRLVRVYRHASIAVVMRYGQLRQIIECVPVDEIDGSLEAVKCHSLRPVVSPQSRLEFKMVREHSAVR